MGISDRHWEDNLNKPPKKRNPFLLGQENNAVIWLIGICLIFFIINKFIDITYNYMIHNGTKVYSNENGVFELPSNINEIIKKPYNLILHFFSHASFLQLLFSMIWLYGFGRLLQDYLGNKKVIPVFIWGGIFGGIGTIIFGIIFYRNPFFYDGSNAATMSMAVAITVIFPNIKFFENIGKGIPLWVITLVYVSINLLMFINGFSALSFITLFGALGGFIFGYFYKNGKDVTAWMNTFYDWFINLFTPSKISTAAEREKMFYTLNDKAPFTKIPNVSQEKIDKILDKINEQGIQFLTDDEKNILKRAQKDL